MLTRKVALKALGVVAGCLVSCAIGLFATSRILPLVLINAPPAVVMIWLAQTIVVCLFFQVLIFKRLEKAEKVLLAAAYAMAIFSGLIYRYATGTFRSFGWNPFGFVADCLVEPRQIAISAVNAALFVPLYPILHLFSLTPRTWMVLCGFLLVEVIQIATRQGFFDVGDILLYTLGYLVGLGIVKLGRARSVTAGSLPS